MIAAVAEAPACPVCRTPTWPLLELRDVVVHCNLLWRSRDEARAAPRADMRLFGCSACAHVFNRTFDVQRTAYGASYENALDCSPRFRNYAAALADSLVDRYGLERKTIVELGCGRGEFLALLCAGGRNRGFGFDPGLAEARVRPAETVELVRGDFSAERGIVPDLVCCRQVLEHVPDPVAFASSLRAALLALGADCPVVFEVPNALATLRDLAVWDLIYEHAGYFTPESLARCFEHAGFAVSRVHESFEAQFLCLHARARVGEPVAPLEHVAGEESARLRSSFERRYRGKVDLWRENVAALAATHGRVVVWGAGSKGVTFLNLVGEQVAYAIDLNPRKRGMYVAGSGHEILGPADLADRPPDVVLVMNAVYRDEIEVALAARGLTPLLVCA